MKIIKFVKKNQFIAILLAVVLVTVFCVWLYKKNYSSKQTSRLRQAIFLTNGQVYFGYTKNYSDQMLELKEVYYLRTQDFLQPSSEQSDSEDKKKISLVKLGSELHGPTDHMYINRDQIMFIEDMRQDSKINDAITKFIEKNN